MEQNKELIQNLKGLDDSLMAVEMNVGRIAEYQPRIIELFDEDSRLNRAYFYELKSLAVPRSQIEDMLKRYYRDDRGGGGEYAAENASFAESPVRAPWDPAVRKREALEKLQEDPHDLATLKILAQLEFEEGNWHAAASYFESIIELEPDYLNAYRALSRIAYSGGSYEQSLGYAWHEWEVEPSPQCAVVIARNLFQLGQSNAALDRVADALEMEPDYVPAYLIGGEISVNMGRNDDALNFYGRANEIRESAELEVILGDISRDMGRNSEALAHWEKAVEKAPANTREDQEEQLALLEKMALCACELGERGRLNDYVYSAGLLGGSEELSIIELRFLKEQSDYVNVREKAAAFGQKYPSSLYKDEIKALKKWAQGS